MSTHIVTGGTGFVGAALVLELLRQTDDEIVCLVRPGKGDIEIRLEQSLQKAARLYGYNQGMASQIKKRCRALPADMAEDFSSAVPLSAYKRIAQFWHCAACLKYEKYDEYELQKVNVQGTLSALTLAELCHAEAFNYISTAYVSGKRTGIIRETLFVGQTNNCYEESKQQAESLVASATHLQTRIFRPSLVIGNSKTYAASGSFIPGIYSIVKKLWDFKRGISDAQNSLFTMRPLRVMADPEAPQNMIPLDGVAEQAVSIALSSSGETIFHLTNSTPASIAEYSQILCSEVGMPEPIYVTSTRAFTPIDQYFYQETDFFNPYFIQHKTFDRTNSNTALENPHAGDFIRDRGQYANYIRWYLESLEQQALSVSVSS